MYVFVGAVCFLALYCDDDDLLVAVLSGRGWKRWFLEAECVRCFFVLCLGSGCLFM